MIAELESRMMNRTFEKVPFKDNVQIKGEQYQVESDYSIDSDNVSWKADLWQLLPQYEKKKLYDQQSVQVTKFLTDIMVNQLKMRFQIDLLIFHSSFQKNIIALLNKYRLV